MEWFRVAAERSVASAQYRLALHLLHGGGDKEIREAIRWLMKAAVQGVGAAGEEGVRLVDTLLDQCKGQCCNCV